MWRRRRSLPHVSTYPHVALSRSERHERASAIARDHDGVVHRRDLRLADVTRADVRSELSAGRWTPLGRHTILLGSGTPSEHALRWRAVWESGSGAVLDGVSALLCAGLTGFTTDHIDVSLPRNTRVRPVPGVVAHRRRTMPPAPAAGIPRVRADVALVNAMGWAASERAAILLLCLAVQQRIVRPGDVQRAWRTGRSRVSRSLRAVLDVAVRDVCAGAHSLGELDIVEELRAAGLPEPSRQIVRQLSGGRVYLDIGWEDVGLFIEIDGGHHAQALHPVADALRQNEVVLDRGTVLRIPVLGLRLRRAEFVEQVVRGYRLLSVKAGAVADDTSAADAAPPDAPAAGVASAAAGAPAPHDVDDPPPPPLS